jgi:hypothetical protein
LIFHGAETVLGAPIADHVGFAEISFWFVCDRQNSRQEAQKGPAGVNFHVGLEVRFRLA